MAETKASMAGVLFVLFDCLRPRFPEACTHNGTGIVMRGVVEASKTEDAKLAECAHLRENDRNFSLQ